MSTPLRILLIRPSALGDVARSVPVLVSLRSAYPEAKISWLLQDGFEDVVRTHPALSAIVPFPRKQLARWWTPRGLRDSFAFLNSLRGKFDLVVDAQGLFRSGLFAWSTRAPRRIGFRDAKECAAIFYNERIRNEATESNRHAVQRMLSLLEGASIPTVRDSRVRIGDHLLRRCLRVATSESSSLEPRANARKLQQRCQKVVRACRRLILQGAQILG